MVSVSRLPDLVNWREGLISPAVHFDEELYEREQERVFNRAWLVVGHEDMVRKPGDYVTNYMGEVPVIVLRDMQGGIRVFVNTCAHRGNMVCLFDRGNAKTFMCSYHGWTYDTNGKLIGVPMEREVYAGQLNKEEWGLEEVPRVANFKGLLFASFDPGAPSLEDWLGEDVRWWLQHFVLVDHIGGLETLPGWHRYQTPGNWKLLAENFIGDDYHVFAATHVAAFKAGGELLNQGIWTSAATFPASRGEPVYEGSGGYGIGCPLGLGLVTVDEAQYTRDLDEAQRLGPSAVDWVRERHHRFLEVLAEREVKPYCFMNGLLFPNLALMGFYGPMEGRHFLLFHPRGASNMEQWQWTMVEREAPQAVKDLAVQRVYQGQHMAGVIAPDDVENLERMVEARRAPRNWRRPFNYRLHLNDEAGDLGGLPGNLGPNPSEVNQRQFYRFWLELMERD